MPIRKPSEIAKKDQKICVQYLSGLKRALDRVMNDPAFDFYNVKIKNPRLAKLLLCICWDRKLLITEYIEELLISQLRKNLAYREYFDNEMECEIQQQSAIRFFQKPYMAEQKERKKGHGEAK
jgi:hypothetical protein